MQDIKAKAQEYLKNNSGAEKVFSTADGQLFTEEMYARQHAAVLTEKEVTKHVKEVEVLAAPLAEVNVQTKDEDGAVLREYKQTVEAPKPTDAPEELQGKVNVITDAVTDQLEAVKETVNSTEPNPVVSTTVKTDPAKADDPATQGTAKPKTTRTAKKATDA